MRGPRWDYKPTPQPGDFVKAKVCPTCGKRTRRPDKIVWSKSRIKPKLYISEKRGESGFKTGQHTVSTRSRSKLDHTCCSLVSVTVAGQVERTIWSKHSNGLVKSFFLVVWVPSLGKRHWATLETVELLPANEYFILNATEDE